MNSIALRPENRRRDGADGCAVQPLSEAELAGLRSEAFAEDLPETPAAEVTAPTTGAASRFLAPLLGVTLAGLLGVLGR